MPKKIYFAGKFNKLSDSKLSLCERLKNDYRSQLLGDSKRLTYYNEECFISKGHQYVGCFYCEKASEGIFTSTDCQIVVTEELKQIDKCDTFIVVFDEKFSTGSIAELVYAATKQKDIIIFYKQQSTKYDVKSEYWFAMVCAQQLSSSTKFILYNEETNIVSEIQKILEE